MNGSRSKFIPICFAVLLAFKPSDQSFIRSYLNGDDWKVTQEPPRYEAPATVPGSMYTALINKQLIHDPLYRDSDVLYAWVGRSDWLYTKDFTVSAQVATSKKVNLVCEGLDTVATVEVNGQVVGHADNMFVRYVFDVSGVLKAGSNNISVSFKSAVHEALDRVGFSNYQIPPECPPPAQNGQCHVNQLRKEQCSFSWDWGPSFPTQGIWKDIYIDAFNTAVIRDVGAVVSKENSQWQVAVEVFFDVSWDPQVKGQLTASIPDLNVTQTTEVDVSTKNSTMVLLTIPKTTDVPLWWPNGYGSQPLFDLDVSFTAGSDNTHMSRKIGFRTVELVQDPVSHNTSLGLSFYFRINGLPIFLKGSNWIPADSFQELITVDRLRPLLKAAADVNINSMRVWGGGIYESEEFYALCDELGIMVWQDLMFSVAMYPTYPSFLQSVKEEVTQQIRRLKSHPAIIVWAGNNENEKALRQSWFGTDKNYTLYYDDYIKLYVKTIMPIIQQEDSSREYLVSSPSDAAESDRQGYVAKDPGSELYGDIHFYDYMADQWNATVFRIPRMASEYGIQSWCNNESLKNVFLSSDYAMDSAMVNHRQHHTGGNHEMAAEVGMHLHMPSSPDKRTEFEDFMYLTQINQAMSMRTQTEHYRRYQSKLLDDGRGLTMGALYWQLNDIWQAPTWASIDYEGSWKMLHYYAKHFFSGHLISPYYLDKDTLDVFIVVDEIPVMESNTGGQLSFKPMTHLGDIKNHYDTADVSQISAKVDRVTSGHLEIDIFQYGNFSPIYNWYFPYNLSSTAESVFTKSISDLLTESACPGIDSCVLYLSASDSSGTVVSTSWFMLAYPKDSKLRPANVVITTVVQSGVRTFDIKLKSDFIAMFVWLSVSDTKVGYFSDNGFAMLAPAKTLTFYSYADITAAELQSQLKVRSVDKVNPEMLNDVIIG